MLGRGKWLRCALLLFWVNAAHAAIIADPTVSAVDSTQGANVGANMLDESLSTIWESTTKTGDIYHTVNWDFGSSVTIEIFCLWGNQAASTGRTDGWQLFTSTDGQQWSNAPVVIGNFADTGARQCDGQISATTRYLRLVVESVHAGSQSIIAEVEFYDTDTPPAPTTTALVEHSGEVDITFVAGGVDPVDAYVVQCKEDSQSDTYYGTIYEESAATVETITVILPNDQLHDCRIQAQGPAANSAWVTTNLQDFFASAHADFGRYCDTLFLMAKRIDTVFQNDACTTAVTADGQEIQCWQDLSGNNNHAKQADVTPQVPNWHEQEGADWFDTEANQHFDLTSAISITGDLFVAGYGRFDGNGIDALYSDAGAHAVRLRPNSLATSDDIRIRFANTNNVIDNFVAPPSNSNWWIMWFFQRDEIAGAGNDVLTFYAALIGDDHETPDVSDWTTVSTTTDGDTIISGTAVIDGAFETDVIGNSSTSVGPDGFQPTGCVGTGLLTTAAERTALFNAMLTSMQE